MTDEFPLYRRVLHEGQFCVVHVLDIVSGSVRNVYQTTDVLLEAPNWSSAGELIINGDGVLWRLSLRNGELHQLGLAGLPALNNDHVPDPCGDAMYVSGYDWHIHRVSLTTGEHRQVTSDDPLRPLRHFLHGVSPDGSELAFVGIEPAGVSPWGEANIFTIPASGGMIRQLTLGNFPADGPEYSPDGKWIYFNTEAFGDRPGHAQIARMRRDGSGVEQLTHDERVNWFPHLAPDGISACYLSYPSGTIGHPENKQVELKLVRSDRWGEAITVAHLHGGQGTINVNSWSPNGRMFAFISYPLTK